MNLLYNIKTSTLEAQELKVGDFTINEEDYYVEQVTNIVEDSEGRLELHLIDENDNEPISVVPKTSKVLIVARECLLK